MIEYMAIKDNRVIGRDYTKVGLCQQILQVLIDDKGRVFIGTNKDTISYNPEHWSKSEALIYFARSRMKHVLPVGVEIFQCENL